MEICTVNELVNRNFNVVFVNALRQFWRNTRAFQCVGEPKKQNLLLFLNGCKITYNDKNGNEIIAESGDIVYTPVGSEYRAWLSDFQTASSYTIGVNFYLYNERGEDILLSDGICIFKGSKYPGLPHLFEKITGYNIKNSIIDRRILLMQIFSTFAKDNIRSSVPDKFVKAIAYLDENIAVNPSVSKMAELCNISEVYFRKLFKEYLGTSPVEYRNILRLNKARSYLEFGDISIQEISDMLGYSTVSHFIDKFKKQYGVSPLKYRKRCRGER